MQNLYNKQVGNRGEEIAAQYLEKLGYKILKRNYRIRGGEIDIVAQDAQTLLFIEVKTRYSHDFGLPIESITPFKIKALLRSAKFYIQDVSWGNNAYRVHLLTIDFTKSDEIPIIELVKDINY